MNPSATQQFIFSSVILLNRLLITLPKGKSWSQQEDLALCEHWLAASEDPVSGTYQKKDAFWFKIVTSLKTDRTSSAVQNRWSDISRDVLKFIGLLTQVSKVYRSGWTVVEYEIQAILMFKREVEKDFLFNHCYEYLKEKVYAPS